MGVNKLLVNDVIESANRTAREKGWWLDDAQRNIPEVLALIHSEVSEALEEYRRDGLDGLSNIRLDPATGKPEGFVVELADSIIRIADLCGEYELDLQRALTLKLAYNQTRSYRHGNKKA